MGLKRFEISTAPTKAKSWEPAYSQALIQNKIDRQWVRSRVRQAGHFYSASSSPLLLRSAPDTARILSQSFMPKRHRQLRVKNLPKVPTRRLERESNPQLSGRKASTLPMRHNVPQSDGYKVDCVLS